MTGAEKDELDHFFMSATEAECTAISRLLGDPEAIHKRAAFTDRKVA